MTRSGRAGGLNTWVLVETVEITRRRYAVETPKDKTDWALDTIVMGEADPLSEVPLGEVIVSSRPLHESEVLAVAKEDGVASHEARLKFRGLED